MSKYEFQKAEPGSMLGWLQHEDRWYRFKPYWTLIGLVVTSYTTGFVVDDVSFGRGLLFAVVTSLYVSFVWGYLRDLRQAARRGDA